MRTFTRWLSLFALGSVATLSAQITNNATRSGGAGSPAAPRPPAGATGLAVDPATAALSATLLKSVSQAHDDWKQAGGAEFMPSLNFVGGKPVLMLVTRPVEPALVQSRRQNAIVGACGFLLDDGAFDQTTICVLEYDPNNPTRQRTLNYRVQRAQFQAATRSVGKSANLSVAVRNARADAAAVKQICDVLGLR